MKEIIDSLKIRFNNPLIASFICSWPFWNWKIIVALIWYKADNLSNLTGYKSYYCLIQNETNANISLIYPALTALLYSISFPLIKWLSNWFISYIGTKENNSIVRATKEANLPTAIYLERAKIAEVKINELSDIIKNESKTIFENAALTANLTKVNNEKDQLEQQLETANNTIKDYSNSTSKKTLDGIWVLSLYKKGTQNLILEKEIEIRDQTGRERNDIRHPVEQFQIKNFIFDRISKNCSLVISPKKESLFQAILSGQEIYTNIIITEAMFINETIESTNDDLSDFRIKMIRKKIFN